MVISVGFCCCCFVSTKKDEWKEGKKGGRKKERKERKKELKTATWKSDRFIHAILHSAKLSFHMTGKNLYPEDVVVSKAALVWGLSPLGRTWRMHPYQTPWHGLGRGEVLGRSPGAWLGCNSSTAQLSLVALECLTHKHGTGIKEVL